jgi:hypothetical protein
MAQKRAKKAESRDEAARSPYRDDDDQREPLSGDKRSGVSPDTKREARGDAREGVGKNARGTGALPGGPLGKDSPRKKPTRDVFDEDLDYT